MDPSSDNFSGGSQSMGPSVYGAENNSKPGDGPCSSLPTLTRAPSTPSASSMSSDNKVTKPSGGKSKKKRKTPTDVNAPKKPVSAYITYLNERRETVKTENPSMTYPDILKKLAAEWSSMPPDDRKKYHEEANRAREKYNKDISEYKTTDLYKKFCEEQNSEQQHRSDVQFSAKAHVHLASPPHLHPNSQRPQPQYQMQQPPMQRQTPPNQLQQNSQLANHLNQTQQQFQQQLRQQQQQQQQQLQRHSDIPPHEFKRELSTESMTSQQPPLPPLRPPLRMTTTPMSPNQTPSPRVTSPNFHLQNQQFLPYPPTNTAGHPTTPMGLAPGNSMASPVRNESLESNIAHDGMMKRTPNEGTSRQNSACSYDIQIFTEEFLEHNRAREGELRHLKKHNSQLEEQNAMLSKHVENMKAAIGKFDSDALHQRTHNRSLQQQLDSLRVNLSAQLRSLPLPGSKDPPNRDNIDDYMNTVYRMMTESPKPENQHFINLFKETIWNLEFAQNQV